MNKIHVKLVILVSLVIILILLRETHAQSLKLALNFNNDNINNVPEAPINMLIYVGLVLGSYFGIKKIKA
ncbi:hypothetical protein [Psychroflexus planctonicus]|uniref:PEP-CTERM protein-sorting domain-containing protein n=1 Tax=Psychroflexus planctonicus TaxID=1526575 RepID=A0ABQ1SFG9_9FLAO|nr:hypothetical protein [Psychroflexus planctonicus]GGE26614.1 hypothetical protein GCM10010832_04140 [Psychroflexus planctonicus]